MPKTLVLLLLLSSCLISACAGTGESGFDAPNEDEGPTIYGQISVSVDAINHD